jgi:hypothetical protein
MRLKKNAKQLKLEQTPFKGKSLIFLQTFNGRSTVIIFEVRMKNNVYKKRYF